MLFTVVEQLFTSELPAIRLISNSEPATAIPHLSLLLEYTAMMPSYPQLFPERLMGLVPCHLPLARMFRAPTSLFSWEFSVSFQVSKNSETVGSDDSLDGVLSRRAGEEAISNWERSGS